MLDAARRRERRRKGWRQTRESGNKVRQGFTTVATVLVFTAPLLFTGDVTLRGHPVRCQHTRARTDPPPPTHTHTQSSFRSYPLRGAEASAGAEWPPPLLLFCRMSSLPEGEDQEKEGGGGLYLTTVLIYY